MKAIDYVLAAPAALLVVFFCFMGSADHGLNADTLLYAVMSTQHVTLFGWGQNRLINLVPALASPVEDIRLNLYTQVLIYGLGFVALLAFSASWTARLVFHSQARIDAWLLFALSLLVFVLVTNAYSRHVFVSEGQPYGLSWLLYLVGLTRVFTRPPAPASLALATVLMVLGAGLNPSLVIVGAAVSLTVMSLSIKLRMRGAAGLTLSVATSAAWLGTSLLIPGPSEYGSFALVDTFGNFVRALRMIAAASTPPHLLGAIVAGLAAFNAYLLIGPPAGRNYRPDWLPVILALQFAGIWVLVFSQNVWIILNMSHFRYFFPLFLIGALTIAAVVALWLMGSTTKAKTWLVVALLVVAIGLAYQSPRPLDAFPVIQQSRPAAEFAMQQQLTLVAGNFWRVWPTVFLINDARRRGFGLESERGIGNRQGVEAELRRIGAKGGPVRVLCLEAAAEVCVRQAKTITGRNWKNANISCGADCLLIEMEI